MPERDSNENQQNWILMHLSDCTHVYIAQSALDVNIFIYLSEAEMDKNTNSNLKNRIHNISSITDLSEAFDKIYHMTLIYTNEYHISMSDLYTCKAWKVPGKE